jgi:hypothetical protein
MLVSRACATKHFRLAWLYVHNRYCVVDLIIRSDAIYFLLAGNVPQQYHCRGLTNEANHTVPGRSHKKSNTTYCDELVVGNIAVSISPGKNPGFRTFSKNLRALENFLADAGARP